VALVWDPPAGYEQGVNAARGRRIWHFEAEPLYEALNDAGAWQAALRVRVARRQALRRHRDGTAFNFRPTPDDSYRSTSRSTPFEQKATTPYAAVTVSALGHRMLGGPLEVQRFLAGSHAHACDRAAAGPVGTGRANGAHCGLR
jgi:hypothetical protein